MHPLGVVPGTTVDCWQSTVVFVSCDFSLNLFHSSVVEWNNKTGGGTLSAPTGCSPRDYGGLLAVDCSLKNLFFLVDHDETKADCW